MRETYVGLLRGINVGGHNGLPMKKLAAIFGKAGCEDVRTYIQSGNVVFTAEPALAASIAERIAVQIFQGVRLPHASHPEERATTAWGHCHESIPEGGFLKSSCT